MANTIGCLSACIVLYFLSFIIQIINENKCGEYLIGFEIYDTVVLDTRLE